MFDRGIPDHPAGGGLLLGGYGCAVVEPKERGDAAVAGEEGIEEWGDDGDA